jgi:hypothetical protein
MKQQEIRVLWEQFQLEYQEYFISNEENWKNTLQQVKDYINNNKKRPSNKDKNKDIKTLGNWVCAQLTNYKNNKQIMKQQEIRVQWEQFQLEYQEYFLFNEENESIVTKSTNLDYQEDDEEIIIPKKSTKLNIQQKKLPEHSKKKSSEHSFKPLLSILHQKYKTMTSKNLHTEFQSNRQLWSEYHSLVEENEKTFEKEDIPRNVIIGELNKIKTKRTIEVVDLGCGKAQIALHYQYDNRFHFNNYDHISIDNNIVIEQDISSLPLEDNSVEIAILCLAMWGSNCEEYVAESNRVLETSGQLYIIEPTKRWTNMDIEPIEPADRLRRLLKDNKFTIIREKIDKFAIFVCMKI